MKHYGAAAAPPSAFFDTEPDLRFGRCGRRVQERLKLTPDDLERLVVLEQGLINFREAFQDLGIGGDLPAHLDERPDHIQAHGHGLRAVEDIGRHQRTMLGEGVGACLGKLEAGEVVAICDHLRFLCGRELKHEVRGKAFGVAVDLFVEAFGGHPKKCGQVGVENDLLLAQGENQRFERRAGFHGVVPAYAGETGGRNAMRGEGRISFEIAPSF